MLALTEIANLTLSVGSLMLGVGLLAASVRATPDGAPLERAGGAFVFVGLAALGLTLGEFLLRR
jgi:hypothetical protein